MIRNRPGIFFVQNPSLVLALSALALRIIFRYRLIMDAHNAGVFPSEGKNRLLNGISVWLQRNVDMTIVTNSVLASVILQNGGNAFVLPDPLPSPPDVPMYPLNGDFTIFVICSYRHDEPFNEILHASRELPERYQFYFSGNHLNSGVEISAYPNVSFLGFVAEKVYWGCLRSCHIVMDLTKRSDCLVCGAYESVSLDKPIILTDSPVNRELFRIGCVYTHPYIRSIVEAINYAETNYEELIVGIRTLHDILDKEWEERKKGLFTLLNQDIR